MRKALSLLILLSIVLCAAAQGNSKFKRSARQQRALERSIQRLETEPIQGSIWGAMVYTTNDAPWILNHYLTIPELYAYADTHHCAQVRAVAVWSLMSRKADDSKEVFFRHVTESAPIDFSGGFCVPNNWTVGDFLFAYANENNYLTERDIQKVDSLLLGSPDAVHMRRRYELLEWLMPNDDELATLRCVSEQCFDPGGLQVLALYHKPQDTSLVLRALDTVYTTLWSKGRPRDRALYRRIRNFENQMVNVSEKWQHPAFARHIGQLRDSLTLQGRVPSEQLMRFAFLQNPARFTSFLDETIVRLKAHPDNKPTEAQPNGALVAKALKTAANLLTNRDYSIDGYEVGSCRAAIYDTEKEQILHDIEQYLQNYGQ
ncbi:MAG: hypothetical protein IKP34_03215 [Bacteroidales bacterium]|nr:hypothetical protein [Bacteroidales bacterium]